MAVDCGCPAGECYHGEPYIADMYPRCPYCRNPMWDGDCYCQED